MKIRKVGCVVLFAPFFPWRAAWHLWQMTACCKQPAARMCPQAVSWRRWLVPPLVSLSCSAALPRVAPGQSGWVPENIWSGENILYPTFPCFLAMTLLHSLGTPPSPCQLLPGGWLEAAGDAAGQAAACGLAGAHSAPASGAALNAPLGEARGNVDNFCPATCS